MDERIAAALRVERALRAAARAGNRLLAGGVARVDAGEGGVSDPETRRMLLTALARMGVRLSEEAGLPAEFVFVDALAAEVDDPVESPGRALPALPAVTVALDGGVRSPRGDDARARIAWAARGMCVTAALAERFRTALTPPRIAVSLVLEPKTAALTLALADAGCEVALFAAASETDPEVAAALAADGRIAVFAPTDPVAVELSEASRVDAWHAREVLDWGPEYLIDDGSHLIRLAHTTHPNSLRKLRAAAEETTSGVRPLREMEQLRLLRIPVISVNDARTKTGFDNLIGTGQSCVFAIADLLDGSGYRGVSQTRWVIVGYGPVGVGVARFAAALGASVTVVERDPVRALAALHDGYEARPTAEALPEADIVVSATGVWHTLSARDFAVIRPGAAVAVAGGIDDELALDELRALGWTVRTRAPGVDEWIAPLAESGPLVLAAGGGVNYSAAEGNPIEVMDLSFATQLAALIWLMEHAPDPGVHELPADVECFVARAALAARGGVAAAPSEGRSAESTDAERPGGAAQPWTVHRYRRPSGRPGH